MSRIVTSVSTNQKKEHASVPRRSWIPSPLNKSHSCSRLEETKDCEQTMADLEFQIANLRRTCAHFQTSSPHRAAYCQLDFLQEVLAEATHLLHQPCGHS